MSSRLRARRGKTPSFIPRLLLPFNLVKYSKLLGLDFGDHVCKFTKLPILNRNYDLEPCSSNPQLFTPYEVLLCQKSWQEVHHGLDSLMGFPVDVPDGPIPTSRNQGRPEKGPSSLLKAHEVLDTSTDICTY